MVTFARASWVPDVTARLRGTLRAAPWLQALAVPPSARAHLRDLDKSATVVTREQWRVACEIDGFSSVTDVACRSGLALHETMTSIADLVGNGLCALG